ncbi:hypothetical protein Zmor_005572 [Zophobas morio]|uniref:Uncharacterized protein n=1 Tax=Zophobas morio TaxID=2755281 RepID=A0AA38MMK2_9CUCU|nr:hypothetical protein Zmor_005572 [Zophobas morio]
MVTPRTNSPDNSYTREHPERFSTAGPAGPLGYAADTQADLLLDLDLQDPSDASTYAVTHHRRRWFSNKEKPVSGPTKVAGSLDGGLQNNLESSVSDLSERSIVDGSDVVYVATCYYGRLAAIVRIVLNFDFLRKFITDECFYKRLSSVIMDENTENLPGTPPEVAEAAGAVNLLPEKSQKLYKIAYNQFMKWKQEKKITSFSERVILAYFADLSSKYKISTLWTYYSMLRSTLNINHNINIEQYHKLRAFLKRQGENYQPKKAKTLSPQQITKFITEAPDVKYLATKVALIMGIMGACRTQELHSMRIQDIKDLNSAFLPKFITIVNPWGNYPHSSRITKLERARAHPRAGLGPISWYETGISKQKTTEPIFFITHQYIITPKLKFKWH